MPPCHVIHLAEYMFELAGGDAPISHLEIASWQRNTGINLNAWEARMLRKISGDYLHQVRESADPACPCPWPDAPYARAYRAIQSKEQIKGLLSL